MTAGSTFACLVTTGCMLAMPGSGSGNIGSVRYRTVIVNVRCDRAGN